MQTHHNTATVAQGDQLGNPYGASTIPDFSRRWGIPESTVWLKIQQGLINVVRLGPRHTRITREEEERITRDGLEKPEAVE